MSREETEKLIDEVNAMPRQPPPTEIPAFREQRIGARRRRRRKEMPTPFELLAMLAESYMDRLSANAFKVVIYVAVRVIKDDPLARNPYISHACDREVAISLKEFAQGVRTGRKRRDYGTGLSKSSIADAINEGVRLGILRRQRRLGAAGRGTLASKYAIEWAQVRQWDEARQRAGKR